MSLSITLSNPIGFPGLSQVNPASNTMQTILPSIYEYGNAFSIDISINYITSAEAETDEYSGITISYKSLTSELETCNVIQLGPNSLRMTGQAGETFIDSFYRFLMPDGTLKNLPSNTTEKFLALVRYNPPGIKRKTISHTINLDITYLANPAYTGTTTSTTTTINNNIGFTQDVVWNYNTAVEQFQSVLAKGVI